VDSASPQRARLEQNFLAERLVPIPEPYNRTDISTQPPGPAPQHQEIIYGIKQFSSSKSRIPLPGELSSREPPVICEPLFDVDSC
jgi:hypothetical protein